MVSTLRCGRSNPGSNPGYGMIFFSILKHFENFTFQNNIFCYSLVQFSIGSLNQRREAGKCLEKCDKKLPAFYIDFVTFLFAFHLLSIWHEKFDKINAVSKLIYFIGNSRQNTVVK